MRDLGLDGHLKLGHRVDEALILQIYEVLIFIFTFGPWSLIIGCRQYIFCFQVHLKKKIHRVNQLSFSPIHGLGLFLQRFTYLWRQPNIAYGSLSLGDLGKEPGGRGLYFIINKSKPLHMKKITPNWIQDWKKGTQNKQTNKPKPTGKRKIF